MKKLLFSLLIFSIPVLTFSEDKTPVKKKEPAPKQKVVKKEQEKVTEDLMLEIKDSKENVMLETYDKDYKDAYIHKNVIKK